MMMFDAIGGQKSERATVGAAGRRLRGCDPLSRIGADHGGYFSSARLPTSAAHDGATAGPGSWLGKASSTSACFLVAASRCPFIIIDRPAEPEPLPSRPGDPDPDLRDARLGPQHRRRARRPARPRLRRLLRGRRLFLRAAVDEFRPRLLGLPADGRPVCRPLGHRARLSGAAPARRLPRHRHAGLRRDHPRRPAQLGRLHRRSERPARHSQADALRPGFHPRRRLFFRLLRHPV